MEFKDFIQDEKEYQKKRNKLIKELEKETAVQEFLEKHSLKLNEVYELNALKTFADKSKLCLNCQGLERCPYELKGHALDLEVLDDHHVRLIYSDCSFLKRKKFSQAFYKNFIVRDIASSFDDISLDSKTIDFESENSKVLYVLLKKIFMKERKKGLFIYGPFGVGKTYLLIALANSLAKNNEKVAFCKYGRLINELRTLYISDREAYNKLFSSLCKVPYLILDDLGTESASSFGRDDILFSLFDYRLENALCTLISSNNDLNTLKINYGNTKGGNASINELNAQRLLERIEKLCDPIAIGGRDRRHF